MTRDTLQKFNTSQIANKPKVNEGGGVQEKGTELSSQLQF